MAGIDDELRKQILVEFKQVLKLAPFDHTENCTNVVMSLFTTQQQELLDRVMEQKETYIDTTQDEAPGHILAVPVSAIKKIQAKLK